MKLTANITSFVNRAASALSRNRRSGEIGRSCEIGRSFEVGRSFEMDGTEYPRAGQRAKQIGTGAGMESATADIVDMVEMIDCARAEKLMSPHIDSMTTTEEAFLLKNHMRQCGACSTQLEGFIAVRNLLARIETPTPPEDLALESRIRLSHVRNDNTFERIGNRLADALKVVAVPAVGGVVATMLLFGVLLGSFGSVAAAVNGRQTDDRFVGYLPVRPNDATMLRLAEGGGPGVKGPLTLGLEIGDDGLAFGYNVLSGRQTPELRGWIAETLLLARFSPAKSFGRPVDSKIILSFVSARS